MRVGILGGTFDPVHIGHLKIAQLALGQLKLDRVLFTPAGAPWLKADKIITAAVHREKMIDIAIADYPAFELSTIELEREGATYTADTLEIVRKTMDEDIEIFFIMGWDSLVQLPRWKRPGDIVKMCRLVAFTRVGMESPDLQDLERKVPGISRSAILLDMPPVDISSSDIRDRVLRGLSIKDMVPEGVEDYIKTHRLYMETAG